MHSCRSQRLNSHLYVLHSAPPPISLRSHSFPSLPQMSSKALVLLISVGWQCESTAFTRHYPIVIYSPLIDLLLNSLPPFPQLTHLSFCSGFGSQMVNTPMVILWPNSDGSVTLSQRSASGRFMPTVVSSPPRVASLQNSLVDVSILILIFLVTFLFY